MSSNSHSPGNVATPWVQQHDARLLASLLRTSRLTLLYGDAGVSRSGLLREGVLPLLTRRAGDGRSRGERSPKPASLPFAERRDAAGARGRGSERVVLFDGWRGAPLADLRAAILASVEDELVLQPPASGLSGVLFELSQRLDLQFLVVLDGFEELWRRGRPEGSVEEMIVQLSEAVRLSGLRANFLVSIASAAEGRLQPLRERIPGFDDATLRLRTERPHDSLLPVLDDVDLVLSPPPGVPADSSGTKAQVERPRRVRPQREPRSPVVPIKTEGVYAFIESTLTQTSDVSRPWHGATEGPDGAVRTSAVSPAKRQVTPDNQARLPSAAIPAGATVEPTGQIGRWTDWLAALWRREPPKR